MIRFSPPRAAAAAQTYFRDQYAGQGESYYSQAGQVEGQWQGKLATELGLAGAVRQEDFARLSEGQHPVTGEQLVQHRAATEYTDADGKKVTSTEHRAGWDATFSAPKSVSLTALIGGDDRVREAHREAVTKALDELERFTAARLTGDRTEQTGKLAAAKFEHDTARPVDGYAAPQLHTHAFVLNMTRTADGRTASIQPHEMFSAQQYATAVYRAELAARLQALGYQIERGEHGKFEIAGYTQEYLRAESPRRQEIVSTAAERGVQGAKAAEIIALETRNKKLYLTQDQVREMHQEHAAAYGNQPQAVVAAARQRQHTVERPTAEETQHAARQAVRYAVEHLSERAATFRDREVLTAALNHAQANVTTDQVRHAFSDAVQHGEIVRRPDGRLTTHQAMGAERDNIRQMLAGKNTLAPIADEHTQAAAIARIERAEKLTLTQDQRQAAQQILSSRDRYTTLEGVAGAGKTTTLAAIREAAEAAGYEVKGLAPTTRAAQKLAEAGMETTTLQKHLAASKSGNGQPRLLVLDESSLASTRQIHDFIQRLTPQDRVLLVGNIRQHEAVEAGRPFAQLQEAGMETAKLTEIMRQRDPELRAVVEQLATGKTREAVEALRAQGRVTEIAGARERIQALAHDYAERPEKTLVVSPDNASRREINEAIRAELQHRGVVSRDDHRATVLEARQEMTGAARKHAQYYHEGDVVRYARRSSEFRAGETARVVSTDAKTNTVTVKRDTGERVTYDPRRLHGVQVYREAERQFSVGDRVQTTSPIQAHKLAGRELGTIEKIERGAITVRFEGGRTVSLDAAAARHLDHGYAVTSHSSQGQTARRAIIHADTAQSAQLLNQRMGYVAVSRAAHDVHIYTDDAAQLGAALSRDRSHDQALMRPLNWEQRQHDATKPQQRQDPDAELRQRLGLDKPSSAAHRRYAEDAELRARLGLAPRSEAKKHDNPIIQWVRDFLAERGISMPLIGQQQQAQLHTHAARR
jgi:conjugative relaxase-like TrwC/TraI family protein